MVSEAQIQELTKKPLPRHVAIIMDGNGRWAKTRGRPRTFGHKAGVETVERIVEFASKIGLHALTLYSFSSENWKRPAEEVGFLMKLLATYLQVKLQKFIRNNIRFRAIGRLEGLPPEILDLIRHTTRVTESNTGTILNLALNYSGRHEILDAVRGLLAEDRARRSLGQRIEEGELDEALFQRFLYAPDLPDPDLVIRTSGEHRISNFLLWEAAYSEFHFTPKFWPDFTEEDFMLALDDYFGRSRRYGGLDGPCA